MSHPVPRAAVAALALASACTVGQKRAAVETTVEGKPQTRQELFEATLRVLDANKLEERIDVLRPYIFREI